MSLQPSVIHKHQVCSVLQLDNFSLGSGQLSNTRHPPLRPQIHPAQLDEIWIALLMPITDMLTLTNQCLR
jgi:hypothetical protein